MRLVKIQWADAVGADGWASREELEKEVPVIHNSVGYIVKETEGFITITMSYNDKEDNLGGWILIPKVMIIKVTDI